MNQWLRKTKHQAKEMALTLISPMPPMLYLKIRWRARNFFQTKEELERRRLRRTIASENRSIKPFYDSRAIFVHVPKCAGDSVKQSLFGDDFSDVHRTLDEYADIFEPECITAYFKFTIVRNPWDRLVSAYHFLRGGGINEGDRLWFSSKLGHFKGFDEFVRGWLNKDNIWKRWYFQPQYHFILEFRGKIQMDFVGLFENLDKDCRYLAKRLGVDRPVKSINKSKHEDYKSYYNEETMNIVADVYDTDIKLLGYNFDNSSLPQQLAKRSAGRALDLTAPGLYKSSSQHFMDLY
jgi:hypothetical protein